MRDYEKLYTNFFNKSQLLLPAIQVSEFINRCIRLPSLVYIERTTLKIKILTLKKITEILKIIKIVWKQSLILFVTISFLFSLLSMIILSNKTGKNFYLWIFLRF